MLSRLANVLIASTALLSTCLFGAGGEKFAVRNYIQDRKSYLDAQQQQPYHFLPPVQPSQHQGRSSSFDTREELELLDICLVVSVDGKFHALNRSSGRVLWSMSSSVTAEHPTALGPLVRTQHVDAESESNAGLNDTDFDSDSFDGEHKELYIIEPQSGDIYVLPHPDEPLQRLPFSMPQLVDMSPFSFSGDDEHRVFVGKKETSLLILELETGRLKGTVNANSECPWDPFGDLDLGDKTNDEELGVDLDELDGTKPPKIKAVSTEVLIGRTDYHVSIHTRPRNPSEPRLPVQNLTFSTYGPNNQDLPLQSTYRRTPDDMYIQPTSAGEIMSFRTSPAQAGNDDERKSVPLWGVSFRSPIVAVFDILQAPDRPSPMALLQPQPRLQDFIPNFKGPSAGSSSDPLTGAGGTGEEGEMNVGATYVGMIPENRALYALSPSHYPLAIFSRPNWLFAGTETGRLTIDGSPEEDGENGGDNGDREKEEDSNLRDLPMNIDDVTRILKERARCSTKRREGRQGEGKGKWDRSCVVGARPVAAAGQSRLSRLLPDRPYGHAHAQQSPREPTLQFNSGTGSVGGGAGNESLLGIESGRSQSHFERRQLTAFGGSVLASIIFLVGLWYVYMSRRKTVTRPPTRGATTSRETAKSTSSNSARDQTLDRGRRHLEEDAEKTGKPVKSHDFAESKPLPALPEAGTSTDPNNSNDDFVIVPRPHNPNSNSPLPVPSNQGPSTSSAPGTLAEPGADSNEANEDGEGDEDSGQENENEGDKNNAATPGKKKGTRRRKRGKKGKGIVQGVANGGIGAQGKDVVPEGAAEAGPSALNPSTLPASPSTNSSKDSPATKHLVVSEEVLGYGSHGTIVYRGSLQGRAVAVKRLLKDFVTLASREVMILQESDDHPNVIRYYYQESHANFLYIALELCPASLADVIEHPDLHRELSNAFDPKKALQQIASGLRHLHALKIIHRDIKPQNILISNAKRGAGAMAGHRMLISDFGLCKRLEVDQTSFLPTAHGAGAAGTIGWRAPEILRGDVNLEDSPVDDSTQSSRGSSVGTAIAPAETNRMTRLTKSVDIFALGCLFYYILTSGGHPYGDRYEREANIMKDVKDLTALESFGEEGLEAIELITLMLDPDPSKRPDTTTCLIHPFFWNPGRRLTFLQDASDRFEIMCRDPRDPDLVELEKNAYSVVGNDWQSRLDKVFLDNLGKFRKYDGKSVQDLLRALRNKKHHYQDMPENVKRHLGPLPDGFLSYFTRRFPYLFMHVHSVISRTNLRYEAMFKSYFELTD